MLHSLGCEYGAMEFWWTRDVEEQQRIRDEQRLKRLEQDRIIEKYQSVARELRKTRAQLEELRAENDKLRRLEHLWESSNRAGIGASWRSPAQIAAGWLGAVARCGLAFGWTTGQTIFIVKTCVDEAINGCWRLPANLPLVGRLIDRLSSASFMPGLARRHMMALKMIKPKIDADIDSDSNNNSIVKPAKEAKVTRYRCYNCKNKGHGYETCQWYEEGAFKIVLTFVLVYMSVSLWAAMFN